MARVPFLLKEGLEVEGGGSILGELVLTTDSKLSFHDSAGGENIVASADGHLEINAGTTLDITAPTVDINAATKFNVDGPTQLTGAVTIGVDNVGHDCTFYGDTSGRYLQWDQSADALVFADNVKGIFGAGSDMQIYHDGTNSHISSQTGALNIGTNNGATVINIGPTASSVVTIGDNLTVTGTTTLTEGLTGALALSSTLTVGADTDGHDVKFFGNTTAKYMLWDESADTLIVAGTLTETSMREMKTNIEPIENILPSVLQMQGVKFDWKDDDHGTNNYGFIAEDVEKILPNLVSHNKEGKAQGIQYSKMTAVLLEAIKEQQVQIDKLKSKILN